LITTYGEGKFLLYMKNLLQYSNHDEVFKGVYDIEFSKFIENFKNKVVESDESKRNLLNQFKKI